jgi:hypothetical protein
MQRAHHAREPEQPTMPQTFNVGARSLFVTVTAWVFILLGAVASASALLQNAGLASFLLGLKGSHEPLPLLTGWLMRYLPWVVHAGLVFSLATLAAAVGLLLRLDAARRVFIGMLALTIAANLLGLWLQQELVQSLVDATLSHAALPQQAASVFGGFVTAARSMAVVMTLGACALLAWIIRRLMSAPVRQEFA